MFFAIDLLLPQHGGRFATAWLAATRGLRYVKKKEIVECDIINLCNNILEMVMNSSNRPRFRMSLSLAARLISGTVRIYRQQVILLQGDLVSFLMEIRKPLIVKSPTIRELEDDSEEIPVPKVLRKRKRKIVLTPQAPEPAPHTLDLVNEIEVDENQLAKPPETLADVESITLREVVISKPRPEIDPEDIGYFGFLEEAEPPTFPEFLKPATPPLQKSTAPAAIVGEKQIVPARKPEDDGFQVVPQISSYEVQEPVQTVQPEVEPPRKRRRQQPNLTKMAVKTRVRAPRINRCVPGQEERFDIEGYEVHVAVSLSVNKPQVNEAVLLELMAPILEENETMEQCISKLRVSESTRASLLRSSSSLETLCRVTEGSSLIPPVDTPQLPESHQLTVTVDVHVPTTPTEKQKKRVPKKALEPPIENREEPQVETTIPPTDEITEIIIAPPAARAPVLHREEEIVTTTSPTWSEKVAVTKTRQRRILGIVKNWNPENQGALTIERICPEPINRCNIATVFGDLLYMHKMEYVKLNTKEDSLELGTIEKGKRVLEKK